MKHLLALLPILAMSSAHAAGHDHHAMMAGPAACAEVSLACADKATPFFAADGTLWLAWSANGRVALQKSRDLAGTFDKPVFINSAAEKLDGGADSRPQIVVDSAGRTVVAYTIAVGANFAGQVKVSFAEKDKAFSPPKPLTDNTVSQRFVAFALDPSGDVFAAWIDKRNLATAQKAGKDYDGAALAFAWAQPGKDFSVTRIAQDNTCECCRLGVGFAGPHRPVVMWRNLFAGGVRDHAVMTFNDAAPGETYRVAVDGWKIDACPHQGPSLAVGADGAYHATWFTDGSARQGLFYAFSKDGGKTFSTPMAVGNSNNMPTRPFVYTAQRDVWLAWKEFDGEESVVMVMNSRDNGATWSQPRLIARTNDASDHPLLIGKDDVTYLSWLTHNNGYRLIALEKTP